MPKDRPPQGGWLGPPPMRGIKPLAIAKRVKNGKWVWADVPQSRKDKELRADWEGRMKKADAKDKWRFKWKGTQE
jgi:hypothetical protein